MPHSASYKCAHLKPIQGGGFSPSDADGLWTYPHFLPLLFHNPLDSLTQYVNPNPSLLSFSNMLGLGPPFGRRGTWLETLKYIKNVL